MDQLVDRIKLVEMKNKMEVYERLSKIEYQDSIGANEFLILTNLVGVIKRVYGN